MYNYKKRVRLARLKVGILVTVGLLTLAGALIFSGNLRELFARRVTISALFSNVQGLTKGAPVWFAGREVGSVKRLGFDEGRILVSMSIDPDIFKYLKTDSDAEILTLGLLGDKYVALTPGTPEAAPLQQGGTLKGTVEHGFQDAVESSGQAIRRANEVILEIQKLLGSLESGKGTLSLLLNDPVLYENLSTMTRNLSELLANINQGRGTLGKLIMDKTLYEEMLSSAHAINDFTTRLAGAGGSLERFIKDPALYDNLRLASQTMADLLKEVKSGKGTLGRLMKGDELYLALDGLVHRMNAIAAQIESGQGTAGQLVKSDRIAQELSETIQELKGLIQDIRKNPRRFFTLKLF